MFNIFLKKDDIIKNYKGGLYGKTCFLLFGVKKNLRSNKNEKSDKK